MAINNIPNRINFFTQPFPLSAIALMAVNDHVLKYKFPGFITGKLSDFCGIFYFPIFLVALVLTADELFELKIFRLNKISAVSAIVVTDFLLLLVKLSPVSARIIEKYFEMYLFPIQLMQDPTDLFALMVNPFTYLYLRSYWVTSKVI